MSKDLDYLIIGAGPAGLQLAYFLQQNNHSYAVLEKGNKAGVFFEKFPVHRTLISINKVFTGYDDPNYNLRWDWNSLISENDDLKFTKYTKKYFPDADLMVKYLNDFANKLNLNIKYNSDVEKISRYGGFVVQTKDGKTYKAKRLIMATGVSKPYIPNIPGIECTEQYVDLSLDTKKYENKKVLIIGKANSAFETADHLIGSASLIHMASPNPIKMAWRTHFVGHVRAVNNNFLDTYQLKAQNAIVNADIEKIEKKGDHYNVTIAYTLANKEVEVLQYDHIICCAGFKFDASIFDDTCKPKLAIKNRFPKQNEHYESVNIPDLYFAGTIMQMRDFKKKQSGFIHGFRYNVQFLAQYLENKYYNTKWPHEVIANDPKSLTEALIKRANSSSSLWQQTGYYCDAIAFDENLGKFKYYKCLPKDYALNEAFKNTKHVFLLTLEFGLERIHRAKYVFAIERIHKFDADRAEESTGIHPIVYHYKDNNLESTHHLIEDFYSEWLEPEHIDPLEKYLENCLDKIKKPQTA